MVISIRLYIYIYLEFCRGTPTWARWHIWTWYFWTWHIWTWYFWTWHIWRW